MHTVAWTPAFESGLLHDDPMISIRWPTPVTLMSERDRGYPPIENDFSGVLA
jgi:dTDP-4-dehydrorhamnose 3,5-epimerase